RQVQVLLDELSIPCERMRVIVNGQPAAGASARAETVAAISKALDDHGLNVDAWLRWDARAQRASVRLGLPLALARRRGHYAKSLQRFLDSILLSLPPSPAKTLSRRTERMTPASVGRRAEREVVLPWRQ